MRKAKGVALMPARPIEHHHEAVMGMTRRHFVKKDLHAVTIHVWQNQRVEFAIDHGHGSIGIGIFLGDLRVAERTDGLGTPAAACVGDAAKAGFVLKYQPERPFRLPRPVDVREGLVEFFFHSSCAGTSA